MKTVKKDGEYKRVSDSAAIELVAKKGWSYCLKQEWKTNIRDVGKPAPKTQPGKSPEEAKPVKKKKEKNQDEYKKSKKDKKDGK